MGAGRYPGRANASEYGAPATSAYGAALRRAIGGATNRPAPVRTERGMGMLEPNRVGTVATRMAQTSPVGAWEAYGGRLPLDAQPTVSKPRPWWAAYLTNGTQPRGGK